MGTVVNISEAHPMDNPATRADYYLAEALRMIAAAVEATSQVESVEEQIRLQTQFLTVANSALAGIAAT